MYASMYVGRGKIIEKKISQINQEPVTVADRGLTGAGCALSVGCPGGHANKGHSLHHCESSHPSLCSIWPVIDLQRSYHRILKLAINESS